MRLELAQKLHALYCDCEDEWDDLSEVSQDDWLGDADEIISLVTAPRKRTRRPNHTMKEKCSDES